MVVREINHLRQSYIDSFLEMHLQKFETLNNDLLSEINYKRAVVNLY